MAFRKYGNEYTERLLSSESGHTARDIELVLSAISGHIMPATARMQKWRVFCVSIRRDALACLLDAFVICYFY